MHRGDAEDTEFGPFSGSLCVLCSLPGVHLEASRDLSKALCGEMWVITIILRVDLALLA